MNGAESLVRTLLASGVDTCFTNPGTSEMHFVAALDRAEGMRCVLGLFEGVVTGAADGYARMAGRPASTLLHLGPGLGNGLANLHNASKACTPIVNIVGDHATYHLHHGAPLTSDIEGIARPVSAWVRTTAHARAVARDGAEAVAAATSHPGQVATLVLPADAAWGEAGGPVDRVAPAGPTRVDEASVREAARVLRSGEPCVFYMTGHVLRAPALEIADRIAQATGARLLGQVANGRLERGAGRVALERLPYPIDQAMAVLEGVRHVILVGTQPPVAFFAYPGKPSLLAPARTACTRSSGSPTSSARRRSRRACRRSTARRSLPARSSPSKTCRAASAHSCPRTQSSPTRPSPPAAGCTPSPVARHRTIGCKSAAARSASACRSRPAPRSLVRTAR
jgi:acetolactate synthase-1/2/3 large subunit